MILGSIKGTVHRFKTIHCVFVHGCASYQRTVPRVFERFTRLGGHRRPVRDGREGRGD